ncbi:MAG: pentapeptide repeat-containing protein [Chroococcidiopsidaceae cyanobacterium CP_BM_ER_R8_30]|nr:pentapeptide repeat-containing protein [Chroococcidiopsidaceae cyanobacterium CP_BM_ER_R8_30]
MSTFPDLAELGYQIVKELGHNRAGGRVTYLAHRTASQPPVVIKQFQFAHSDSNWSEYEAIQREVQLLQQLDHPSIPHYVDSFETPSGFCLVQEYKPAESLVFYYHWSVEEVKRIAIALLEALVYLQSACPPIIHRDIKPEHILVERQGELKVYLVDFGFAHRGGGEVAVSSVVKGTLGFMPPEQLFNRQLTLASDLYSLGATLICLLTKTKSTQIGNLIDSAYRLNFRRLVPHLNSQFIEWLQRMVAPSLKYRFDSAAAALEALKPIPVVGKTPKLSLTLPCLGLAALSCLAWVNTTLKPYSQTQSPAAIASATAPISRLLKTHQCPGCDLRGANLENANLKNANLTGANLENAQLTGADLSGAHLTGGVNLGNATLTGANLENANLTGASLWEASLGGADLRGANLTGADLKDANLEGIGTNLERTNLEGANLGDANLGDVNLWSANLTGANLEGTNLDFANLAATQLTGANFIGADIMGTNFIGATMPDGSIFNNPT